MKKNVFYLFTIICFSLLFFNCEKDNNDYNFTTSSNNPKIQFLKSNEIQKITESIKKKTNNDFTLKFDASLKSNNNKSDSVYIDISTAIKVEDKNGITNTTFNIITPFRNESRYYNYVIHSENNNEHHFVLEYSYDNTLIDATTNKFKANVTRYKVDDGTIIADLITKSEGCYSEYMLVMEDCGCDGHHWTNTGCTCGGPKVTSYEIVICSNRGGNTSGNNNWNPNSGDDTFTGNSGGVAVISNVDIATTLKNLLGLNSAQFSYLLGLSTQELINMNNFLGDNNDSQQAKNFALETINAGVNGNLVTPFPLVKYPEGSNYASQYPKLTEYLKNKLPKIGDIPLIVNTIKDITGLNEQKIKTDLLWNKGPVIEIVQLDNYAPNTDENTAGAFDKTKPNTLLIDIDYVQAIENSTAPQYEEDGLLFYIGSTILHEYVHLGVNSSGVNYPGEAGIAFELRVYGQDVQPSSAQWMILNKYY